MTHGDVTVVTGASSGIGLGFAERLAARGHDLVLIARREDRLHALAERLRASARITAHVLPCDLSDPTAAVTSIRDALAERALSVDGLVNAAGFGTAGPFVAEDEDRIASEMLLNMVAPTLLTRLLLPSLLAAPRGLLVNVSSTASAQPVPNLAVYSATKAYVTSLTAAVWRECRGSNVRVLALCPGPTETEFFDVAGSDRFRVGRAVPAGTVIDHAFRVLDGSDRPVTTVGLGNRIQGMAARFAPLRLTLAIGHRATSRSDDRSA